MAVYLNTNSPLEKFEFLLNSKYYVDKSNIIDSKNIDLMFVPLIGFDKYNHRLGYGKGYYDRYLKNNNVTLDGNTVRLDAEKARKFANAVKKGKNIFKYI